MNVEKQTKGAEMSDVALAADLIRNVAGERGHSEPIKVLWERAYERLSRHREIREMAAVIAEQERLRDAREEHRKYVARLARLEALLATTDEAFHGPEIGALRGALGRMDRPGIKE